MALTKTQRRILWACRKHDTDLFTVTGHLARKEGFGFWELESGALCIRSYGTPEWFMKTAELCVPAGGNYPRWYMRLTEAGRAARDRLRPAFPI